MQTNRSCHRSVLEELIPVWEVLECAEQLLYLHECNALGSCQQCQRKRIPNPWLIWLSKLCAGQKLGFINFVCCLQSVPMRNTEMRWRMSCFPRSNWHRTEIVVNMCAFSAIPFTCCAGVPWPEVWGSLVYAKWTNTPQKTSTCPVSGKTLI